MQKNIIIADKNANTFDLTGERWKIHLSGAETGNQFSLVECVSPPGSGSPVHRHIRADQAIYVLEGELEIDADSERFLLAKGESCLIRRGTPHRELNSTQSPTRFITTHSPGFFSEFVRLAGTPARPDTKVSPAPSQTIQEVRKVAEIGLEFDVEILTPLEQLVGTGKS
jgi:quercetin dioxygenase-like cupin family protein